MDRRDAIRAMLGAQLAGQWTGVTGGFNGLNDIPELPGLGRYDTLYWLIAATAVMRTSTIPASVM